MRARDIGDELRGCSRWGERNNTNSVSPRTGNLPLAVAWGDRGGRVGRHRNNDSPTSKNGRHRIATVQGGQSLSLAQSVDRDDPSHPHPVPARLARSARQITLHLRAAWPGRPRSTRSSPPPAHTTSNDERLTITPPRHEHGSVDDWGATRATHPVPAHHRRLITRAPTSPRPIGGSRQCAATVVHDFSYRTCCEVPLGHPGQAAVEKYCKFP